MTGRYNFDPNAVAATMTVFEKGEYTFKLTSVKSFLGKEKEGKETSYGVRVTAECQTPGAYLGKKAIFNLYMHNEGSQSVSKQVLMAAYGYEKNPEAEAQFNSDFTVKDWSFNPEDGSVGEVWNGLINQQVIAVNVPKIYEGNAQNAFGGWRKI